METPNIEVDEKQKKLMKQMEYKRLLDDQIVTPKLK